MGKKHKNISKVVNVRKKSAKNLLNKNKTITFAATFKEMVPWMSGLVNGLQNRLRRFESARHLLKTQPWGLRFYFLLSKKSSDYLGVTEDVVPPVRLAPVV